MSPMLRRIALLLGWILIWGTGGSLIDAGLIRAGVYSLETGQLGTAATVALWTLTWAALGLELQGRIKRPGDLPDAPPQGWRGR
ncbi:hypothetical protein [Cyanobium sp. Morenito 9A2]|uniref:hypothetical protein n=1 Tax=Cyanobium sp. Morenito 9A2 TaxID=2823718 RepID=UPI0020CBB2D6|nr:hypothetical protein [Cyanobium sp. Morenito 9A2]MCP9850800.1 hypothetical protein [Cyanobium sp. Morenito 9A2]